ncbi:hypothetical protein [Nocardia tengchongensis]|uniref:hypothetical protein n=1 Tax=Nocardia tengchongensis TaxID=2055889 RepID=UPI00364AC5EC
MDLPGKKRASWTADGVYIDRSLGQAARRCALAHEIVHIERGPVPDSPRLAEIEERIVSTLAARRLITLQSLERALMWSRPTNEVELAEELWVDIHTLRIRLRTLTSEEHSALDIAVRESWPWHCDT